MHNKAMDIREKPGTYKLVDHNCNQVAQEILDAGGKRFDFSRGWNFATMPNNVRDKLVELTHYSRNPNYPQIANSSIVYTDYWDWKFGTIDELGKQLYGNSCSR